LSIHQIVSLIANAKRREELPNIKSVNFTKIVSLLDKKIKISLFLKTKKVKDYIEELAKDDELDINSYFYTTGRGKSAKTFLDDRLATFILSEISMEFRYQLINSLVMGGDDIIFECRDIPMTAVKS
jgi:hypothetical protein